MTERSDTGTGAQQRLEAERRRTTQRLAALDADHAGFVSASQDSNADDEHDPEGATIAFERSQVATLRRAASDHLDQVDAALARLSDGRYGTCERCGRPIPAARLEARPMAVTCVGCAT